MNMNTTAHTTTLVTLECCKCGMPLGLSATWVKQARGVGNFTMKFWCPYCGTSQGWGESGIEKQIKRLTEDRDRLLRLAEERRQAKDLALAEAEHFRRSRDGLKGELKKVKQRVGRGVCPCCNRTFGNLKRHMQSKHPELGQPE